MKNHSNDFLAIAAHCYTISIVQAHVVPGNWEIRMIYTTQKQIRAAFWKAFPDLPRRKIINYSGNGKMYPTDTRCAFCDFVDSLNKDGNISDKLADSATL